MYAQKLTENFFSFQNIIFPVDSHRNLEVYYSVSSENTFNRLHLP